MARGVELVAVFLACLTLAVGIPTQFPHGKTLVYNYYGDVKAGIIEPAPYASQFAIAGDLHIKHDTSDPTLPHAYYVTLKNVKTGMHNGLASHFERTGLISPVPDVAKVIEEPFLIVNNEKGELQGVKIPENEAGWSKNMKMAMASMLQLDLTNIKLETPVKYHSFISLEKTIQGDCWTSYDVGAKLPVTDEDKKNIVITKFTSPRNCTNYNVYTFDHDDPERCSVPREKPVNMASRRVINVELQDDNVLIKSLIAHGGSNYFPLNARSEAHYVLNNASFVLEKVVPSSEIELPAVDFQKVPLINDLSYKRPTTTYAVNSAVDVTQGRHVVKQDVLISIVKKMLTEAGLYLEEHHLEEKDPDFKHGQTINRILRSMEYMNRESLEAVLNDITVESPTERDHTIKKIFLGVLPQVGTTATILLVRDLILNKKLDAADTIAVLSTLPTNIRSPSVDLLVEMEKLIKVGDDVLEPIRQASILCFSSILYRTFKNEPNSATNVTLQRYLNNFYDHVIHDPKYKMKLTYLNAIRNVEVGNIEQLLAPIIRGEIEVSEHPVHLRLLAIWAIKKSVADNYPVANSLLWPIMADRQLPLKLRIAAYDILIRQVPAMTNILRIYWFMVYEKNEHLYNYHHTTIKSLANSLDPCNRELTELTRKIIRFTRFHAPTTYALSSSHIVDSMDNVYGHGEKIRVSTTLSEVTGLPEVVHLELVNIEGRKPVSEIAIDLHVEGIDETLIRLLAMSGHSTTIFGNVQNENVLNVLKEAAKNMPPTKEVHVDILITRKGRVIYGNHFNKHSLELLYREMGHVIETIIHEEKAIRQNLMYINLYEQQIISEMGLPIVVGTKTPQVSSVKVLFSSLKKVGTTSLSADLKLWRHGNYYMSIYNPMNDVWHSIMRSSTIDISLPLQLILNVQGETLKLTLPVQSEDKKQSTWGVKIHTKDITTVSEDSENTLKQICPKCQHLEVVSKGVAAKKNQIDTVNSRDTGLQYSLSVFGCENGMNTVQLKKELLRNVVNDHKNSRNNWAIHSILGIRQYVKNLILSPAMGSCGLLAKIEPSVLFPTSRLDLSIRNIDDELKKYPEGMSKTILNVQATMDVIAASTNESARSWDLNLNLDLSDGHINNTMRLQVTRKTPGEKSLKICVDAQKQYPALPQDLFKVGDVNDETNTKVVLSVAQTEEDDKENTCPRDQGVITIIAKGELSDDQKKSYPLGDLDVPCQREMNNPLMKNPVNMVPRTIDCTNTLIRHTTLKKYTLNIIHKQVPQYLVDKILEVRDFVLGELLPNIHYTNEKTEHENNITMKVEFSQDNDAMDMSVITPTHGLDLTNVDFKIDNDIPRLTGFGVDYEKKLWRYPMDNTRFTIDYVKSWVNGNVRLCVLFPEIVSTLDNSEIPYELSNEWTLATGNYVYKNFAIFVKKLNDKVAMKIYVENLVVEITPNENEFDVKINDELHSKLSGRIYVPADEKQNHILKVSKKNDQLIAYLYKPQLKVVHIGSSVALIVEDELQGVVAGLCGDMTGSNKDKITMDYRLKGE